MQHRQYLLGVCLMVASGCSALVNPDESRLGTGSTTDGGVDLGMPMVDMGGQDADANVMCAGGCDDGVECTADSCESGTCAHEPNDALCADGERCNRRRGCVPYHCTTNDECNDGQFCNGDEVCDPTGADTGCIPGTAVECGDAFACTVDSCDETANACSHTNDNTACADSVECTTEVCDPADAAHNEQGCVITPDDSMCATSFCMTGAICNPALGCAGGAARTCEGDSDPCTDTVCSDEMSMCLNVPHDGDGDTHPANNVGATSCSGGVDCDDSDPEVHPGATEVCNGKDDNCNGDMDEGCSDRPESCDTAWPITIGFDGHGHVSGTINEFSGDVSMNCGTAASGAPDAVYYIDLNYTADVVIETVGSTFDTILAVSTDCNPDQFEHTCIDDVIPTTATYGRVFLHRVGPRLPALTERVYIVVKSYAASGAGAAGSYQLDVRVSLAANDNCANPIDISSGGLLIGYAGNALFSSDMYSASTCGGSPPPGREAIATFGMPSDGTVQFEAWSPDFRPTLYVRRPSCTGASEVGCDSGSGSGGSGGTAELSLESLAAERYNVLVDGAPTSLSFYTLVMHP